MQLSCTPKGSFVWVESFPQVKGEVATYHIKAGDQISVSVWEQAQISGSYTVRQDGYVSIPLVKDLRVAGATPAEAAEMIRVRLEGDIVKDARVSVSIQESSPDHVSVLGEVAEPGQFVLKPRDTILDLLAMAGGLTEFADEESIYVFREPIPVPLVRFDYERLTNLKTGGIRFKLQDGDVIIVE